MRNTHLCLILVTGALLAGCGDNNNFRSQDRMNKLMAMAGDEMGEIEQPKQRFRRQLQLAVMQTDNGRRNDAARTLDKARETLETADADAFGEHARLAGWVSLSELNRGAGHKRQAVYASDKALERLRNVEPAGQRCQYVESLTDELYTLHGENRATSFLREAGPWAGSMDDKLDRRLYLHSFARELFNYNDYEGGRDSLRFDDDASWRADTLLMLAELSRPVSGGGWLKADKRRFLAPQAVQPILAAESETSTTKHKRLDYRSTFGPGAEMP